MDRTLSRCMFAIRQPHLTTETVEIELNRLPIVISHHKSSNQPFVSIEGLGSRSTLAFPNLNQ